MNIYDALSNLENWRFAQYFKYLHPELRFDQDRPVKTEEEFLKRVERKTMSPFYRWEKSNEYKQLLQLYLDYRMTKDYEEIYNVVADQAKQGDDKAVKLFIQLQKEISNNAKSVSKMFEKEQEEETEEDDGLELD